MEKHLQPHNRESIGDGLKLHLRSLRVNRRDLNLITLRPDHQATFSVNYFHDTWHIVGSERESKLLARLLWGLAFQKQAGTVILLAAPHLKPTPFEAEPSPPVLLVPCNLTPLDEATCQALREKLAHLGPSQKTIRWHTWGLDEKRKEAPPWGDSFWLPYNDSLYKTEQMRARGGFVVYTAPPKVLQMQALILQGMRTSYGTADHYLAEHGSHPGDGEVQIFRDYGKMLRDAEVARREVWEAGQPLPTHPQALRERIWEQIETVKARRSR
jgi:hypothetical protein